MRSWELGDAFGIENLRLAERSEPEAGPGEVVVGVRACSLNYRDLQVVRGSYGSGTRLPLVPLSDGAGEVVAVGPGVEDFREGDRVAGAFMPGWTAGRVTPEATATALGGAADGMLRERVALPASGVVRVPDHLSFSEAATLPCAAVTAWNALVAQGGLKAGETVLALGTGGVSVFALQFAKLHGARVIVTSSSDEKLRRARDLGADETVNYRKEPEWERRVLELTDGAGVDYVVEVGGPGTLGSSLQAVRMGGSVAMIGVLTGAAGEVPTAAILRKSIRVQGIYVGSCETFREMNRAISLNRLRPVIDRTFPFEEFPEALRHLEGASHFGKIVVEVG